MATALCCLVQQRSSLTSLPLLGDPFADGGRLLGIKRWQRTASGAGAETGLPDDLVLRQVQGRGPRLSVSPWSVGAITRRAWTWHEKSGSQCWPAPNGICSPSFTRADCLLTGPFACIAHPNPAHVMGTRRDLRWCWTSWRMPAPGCWPYAAKSGDGSSALYSAPVHRPPQHRSLRPSGHACSQHCNGLLACDRCTHNAACNYR